MVTARVVVLGLVVGVVVDVASGAVDDEAGASAVVLGHDVAASQFSVETSSPVSVQPHVARVAATKSTSDAPRTLTRCILRRIFGSGKHRVLEPRCPKLRG